MRGLWLSLRGLLTCPVSHVEDHNDPREIPVPIHIICTANLWEYVGELSRLE